MSLSMYAATVPPLQLMLANLASLIRKAQAHVAERKIEPVAFLGARLFPDMLPFTRQIQIASDTAKGAGARLAGVENPRYEDTEQTFDDLLARIDKTHAFLGSLQESAFDGAATREIVLQAGARTLEFTGADYLTTWVLPNFHFHVTTAYALLRHGGVVIGKTDYLRGSVAPKA